MSKHRHFNKYFNNQSLQLQTYSVVLRILSVFGSQSAELMAKNDASWCINSIRFTLGQPSLIISV